MPSILLLACFRTFREHASSSSGANLYEETAWRKVVPPPLHFYPWDNYQLHRLQQHQMEFHATKVGSVTDSRTFLLLFNRIHDTCPRKGPRVVRKRLSVDLSVLGQLGWINSPPSSGHIGRFKLICFLKEGLEKTRVLYVTKAKKAL